MEISKNLINTQTGLDSKQLKSGEAKEGRSIFKNQPQNLSQETGTALARGELRDLDKLANKLLNELKSSPSEAQLAEITNQAKSLQVSPNLAKDLKGIITLASDVPELKELADKLKAFLKPIAELKSGSLNEQIKSSGIMLEANLKDALINKNILPSSINKLFGDIKNISNQNLLNQILALTKDDSLSTNESFAKLAEILKNAKSQNSEILNNSSVKSLLIDSAKIENMVKFLDNQANSMSQKGLAVSEKSVKNELNKIGELVAKLKGKIPEIVTEKLSQNRAFSSNLKELSGAIKELEKGLDSILKQSNIINSFAEQILNKTAGNGENLSLQDRLKAVAKKLNQALNLADKVGFEAKENLAEINKLSKQQILAQKDILNIQVKAVEESIKHLQNDVKSTLLNLQSKSAPDTQVNQLSSKLLTQIEMHQLVSSVSGGLQTYLPYIWDAVEGGSIRFKQGKKQKHYAQIDLNFQKFGAINITIGLSENRYIDISIATQKEEFKELILSGSKELKRAIGEQGLIMSGFSLKTMPKLSLNSVYNGFSRLNMGFDKII